MKKTPQSEIPITAYRCKKCGRIHYPFHDRCLDCKGREFEPLHPQGNARLLTYTAIYNLPWGFDQRFLLIGVAEFENKVKAMGQIKAESIDVLKLGMKVRPSWEPVRQQAGEDVYGLKFEPIE
ncbi:predicted nucleic-acid-binding protein containing a Zn-ribbon [Longilinea arvoryzae]|uniref:Predicted nucleic-acid-binding protein containing a Zn-ribbon n=1 Tax=Longilinea arvoryzae TaxID=360412 RepID=A0A0S7BP61_9CHLR|nr:hypothetical protein [Longilinea arvoryzae]GAP15729.1 predicted nucleic-acid-binding protein containing a Zn-ribbon [Longilinea arvoryzae]